MKQIPKNDSFLDAMRMRLTNVPFTLISAHRVKEGRYNLDYERGVLDDITNYLSTPQRQRHRGMLSSCVPEDMHVRLRTVPQNIVYELGYNVIPATQALTLHGVPKVEIVGFLFSIKPNVQQVRRDCERARQMLKGPISQEYQRLKNGSSILPQLCADASVIGDACCNFCSTQGL
ncbi:hypothetical protein [Altererythrobacter sp. GH1-8]|uniref:hypothetical protein n=1 Tax=Altererythrobacter sp. GH1-8 TaxID=3349333 RepID=UPI00374DB5FA